MFLARFVPGLRAFAALVAGISYMHRSVFFFYNIFAGVVWATASILVGYLFGGSLNLIEEWMGPVAVLSVLLLVLVPVFYLAYRRFLLRYPRAKKVYGAFKRVSGDGKQR